MVMALENCKEHGKRIKKVNDIWVCADCEQPRIERTQPSYSAQSCNLENPEICESCT